MSNLSPIVPSANNQGGLLDFELVNQSAKITDATSRQVEFLLSENIELLEVRVSWSNGDNSRGLDQVSFWSQCFDSKGSVIPNSHRPMVVPFVAGLSVRYYFIPIFTPSEATRIVFTCNYIDIDVCIVSRATFLEGEES
ncbi:hypothetical protein QF117_09150 [Vibrio sp. YMD68]|uniref:hypothetical protein n=1 Tax=Vibrio sp. YMD68 TaxID=3042300 RepID=UPI00249BD602|nr:hypothetical protein [Vibrio sp. YMD68]WGW00351.1 hypothetical protein QF117_21225 [Vibrio sp. YMD68]WGW00968.1 hypothetical protein QF117_09150 [Vibrio sp. YMD68]